jgi:hypothetical protein
VKLSIWQFLGIVAVLVGLYYFYNLWWVQQDRNAWIDKLNGNVYNSKEEMDGLDNEPVKESGWL